MRRRLIEGEPAPVVAAPRVEPVKIPIDPVNEQLLLMAAMLDDGMRAKLVRRLQPDAFMVREHVDTWIALTELVRRKLDFDVTTLQQLSGNKLDVAYLDQLLAGRTDPPQNVDHHVNMLEWDGARARAVRGPIAGLLGALRDPTTAPERVRALAESVAGAFSGATTAQLLREPTAVALSTRMQRAERRTRACYPYGLAEIDRYEDGKWRMIPGAPPGKVTVITGTPGSGKSTAACRVVLAQEAQGRRVLLGAWEMHDEPTLELLATMSLGLSRYQLSVGEFDDDLEALLQAEEERLAANILFMGNPALKRVVGSHVARGDAAGNERSLDLINAAIADSGADVAVFDLWKRCLKRTEPDEEEHALIRQQDIAADTRCHCILLQQQRSKDVEGRPDKRPTREGIKGSGAWTEVPDTIIGIHRPALWKRVDDVTLEACILKQRWGRWPIAVEFDWDPDLGSITGGRSVDYDVPVDGAAGEIGGGFIAPPQLGGRRGRGKGKS